MITFDPEKRIFKIDTQATSYILGLEDEPGYLVHYYYGKKLNGTNVRHLSKIDSVPSKNVKDKNSFFDYAPFELSVPGTGDFRPEALEVETADGTNVLELTYSGHRIFKGKKPLSGLPYTFGSEDGTETLEIDLEDRIVGITVTLSYSVFGDCDAVIRSLKVKNTGRDNVYITKIMSMCLDMNNDNFNLMTHTGSWGREHGITLAPLTRGFHTVGSERGISSHQEHPFIALTSKEISQTEGEVYGFNFVYSGAFEAGAFLNQFDSVRVLMGINPYHFRWELEPESEFQAPEVTMVYSGEGLGKMTRTYHRLYREHLIRSPYKDKKRPILINNWEATYFNFNTEKLLQIAEKASKLGIEMLVMDDGWFGNRFDDNRSLGDWEVNEEKLPGGLKRLAEGINSYGMKFGIWMEPEMVSPDSDLYRAHPDWAIQIPGREPSRSRHQLVLDLTREEVWEHTWQSIKNVLSSANIEYLKWDMNRPLTDLYSAKLPASKQGEFLHRYMLAVYRLQEKLVTEFPDLLLENCSSGGGRFDAGMLFYSPQVWASDDTDAVERLKIQEGTAMIYPLSSMGAHVSDCPNHCLGRTTPFMTRGNVALAGTFGYELDVTRIPEDDVKCIPEQVKLYHKYNELYRMGEYYRLASYSLNGHYDAWMVKSQDGSELLITYVNVINEINMKKRVLKLQGLESSDLYRDEETGEEYFGDELMYAGITVDNLWGDASSKLIHMVRVD